MRALAVDFGGSHASCGLVEDRRLIAFEEIDLTGATKLMTALPKIEECFGRLLAANGTAASDCAGIAMGLPSIVDARTNKILGSRAKYEDSWPCSPRLRLDDYVLLWPATGAARDPDRPDRAGGAAPRRCSGSPASWLMARSPTSCRCGYRARGGGLSRWCRVGGSRAWRTRLPLSRAARRRGARAGPDDVRQLWVGPGLHRVLPLARLGCATGPDGRGLPRRRP